MAVDRLGDLLAPKSKKDKKLGTSALAVLRARRRSSSPVRQTAEANERSEGNRGDEEEDEDGEES